jgi:probable F420-dependent oxidoreductase
MTNARRFRFGVVLRAAGTGAEWAAQARRLERLGFDVLLVSDHLVGPRLAPLAALAAAAASTTSLRVGTLVLANDLRHPAVLAKEAATLDVLSGGRFELGIGAGWMRADYDQAGLRYDPPAVRIARLAEALQILEGLWGERPFAFSGRHYAIEAAEQRPRPVQRPRPPILIGGGGPALLRLAARRADGVNLTLRTAPDGSGPDPADVGLAPLLRKLAIVREAAGERWERLEIGTSVWALAVGSGEAAVRSAFLAGFVPAMADTPNVLAGEVPAIVDKLLRWRAEHAVSYYVLQDEAFVDAFAPIVARLAGT